MILKHCFSDPLELLNSPDLNITTLDLSENNLDDKETTIMCNILYKLSGLQRLNLAGSKFTDKGTVNQDDCFRIFLCVLIERVQVNNV